MLQFEFFISFHPSSLIPKILSLKVGNCWRQLQCSFSACAIFPIFFAHDCRCNKSHILLHNIMCVLCSTCNPSIFLFFDLKYVLPKIFFQSSAAYICVHIRYYQSLALSQFSTLLVSLSQGLLQCHLYCNNNLQVPVTVSSSCILSEMGL